MLPNYIFAIPLLVVRTPTGRRSNTQNLRVTPPSNAFFSTSQRPCPPKSAPPSRRFGKLAGKGPLHTTDEGIAVLVRNPAPTPYSLRPAGSAACFLGDEPICTHVSVTHAPLDHASLPFGCFLPSRHGTFTSQLERFYCSTTMSFYTRW